MNKKVSLNVINKLNNIYKKIPKTKGCLESIKKQNGCEAHCCNYNNPSVLYVEFQNSLKNVLSNWKIDDILKLFEKAIRNYLNNSVSKSCIFWDKESKLCNQHNHRPFACQIYGITPKEEFEPKYKRLKILYKDNITAVIKDQCNLIQPEDNNLPTKKDIDTWWEELKKLEIEVGFKNSDINDEDGTYKTFHDHLLTYFLPDKSLTELTNLKINGTYEQKEIAILTFMSIIKNKIQKANYEKES
jgi:Fe-S-cluster containining protein